MLKYEELFTLLNKNNTFILFDESLKMFNNIFMSKFISDVDEDVAYQYSDITTKVEVDGITSFYVPIYGVLEDYDILKQLHKLGFAINLCGDRMYIDVYIENELDCFDKEFIPGINLRLKIKLLDREVLSKVEKIASFINTLNEDDLKLLKSKTRLRLFSNELLENNKLDNIYLMLEDCALFDVDFSKYRETLSKM